MSLLFSKLRFFSFMPCDSIAFPMRVMQPFDKRYFDIRGKRNVRRNATGKTGFRNRTNNFDFLNETAVHGNSSKTKIKKD